MIFKESFAFCLALLLLFSAHTARARPFEALSYDAKHAWDTLNYYDTSGKSDIKNADFFIAKNGNVNPNAEYAALTSLIKKYQSAPHANDLDILCRYPARLRFFSEHADASALLITSQCQDFIASMRPDAVESISLLFASGYFDNPGSYFGHSLLQFNYAEPTQDQEQLDASLNYGADVTDSTSSPLYVLKGLLGGYEASYRQNNHFINNHHYTNRQLRDMWDYQLNLTEREKQFIVEHSWELKRAKFQYFFLNDNCAHRIADLIERATGVDASKKHGFWLTPLQIMQSIAPKHAHDDASLIKKETYNPSLKSVFNENYQRLNKVNKRALVAFLKATPKKQKSMADQLEPALLLLILDHLDLEIAKLSTKDKNPQREVFLNQQRKTVLAALFKKPPHTPKPIAMNLRKPTLLSAQAVSMLNTGWAHRNGRNYASIYYQLTNNDLLKQPLYGQEISQFIMGALRADVHANQLNIRKLTVVDVLNLNTNPLPFSLTNEFSWRFSAGYNARNRSCKNCSTAGLRFQAGKSVRFNPNTLWYAMGGARVNSRMRDGYDFASWLSDTALLHRVNDSQTLKLGVNLTSNSDFHEQEVVTSLDYAISLSKTRDIRFAIESDSDKRTFFGISTSYFFN